MSASVFLETLRKHDLEQFYPTFSTHGITHLQGLAQLSVQDYADLGITDTMDRKRIFTLIQLLRKETSSPHRLHITTSASTAAPSGLRPPQSYPAMNNNTNAPTTKNAQNSPTSPSAYLTRLSTPQNPVTSADYSRISRIRRQSTMGSTAIPQSPTMAKSSAAFLQERPPRTRTLSDAGRMDVSAIPRSPARDRGPDRRKSMLIEPDDDRMAISSGETDDNDDDEATKVEYRTSAPLLNTYGVPVSSMMKSRASMGALRSSATSATVSLPSDLNQKIRVCVRKRPLSKKELDRGDKDIAPAVGTRSIQINEPKLRLDLTRYIEQHTFTFDDVFDATAQNEDVYKRTALPLVKYIFEGGKATCFAYGQTGSGKTYTMLDPRKGLYVLAATEIFALLRESKYQHLSAWIGLYEIYQGQLYDLLNDRKKLFAREDAKHNVIISGLREFPIDNVDKLIHVFEYGNQVRSTGTTGANDTSSRSHAVLQILLKPKKNKKKIHGKLSFIDLAGSERGADRGESDTKTRMEGAEINKSLLALKECIRALDQDKRHTPFRQSKLTQVLKDSFVGNSRTCMIATVSPGALNSDHTLNTLRYADRVKELKGESQSRGDTDHTMTDAQAVRDEPSWATDMSPNDAMVDDDDDKYMQDDSNDDYYSNGESDILDDDTFNEENIFDVDFPHEQDAFIRSSALDSPSHRPTLSRHHSIQDTPVGHVRPQFSSDLRPNHRFDARVPSSAPAHHRSPLSRSSSVRALSSTTTQEASLLTLQPGMTGLSRTVSNGGGGMASSANRALMGEDTVMSNGTGVQFDMQQMEEFVKIHRAEIREVTEYTKRETKLVANISLDLSSNQDFADEGNHMALNPAMARHQQWKSSHQFRMYLRDLDDVLEQKMAAVEALRDRISDTVGQLESSML